MLNKRKFSAFIFVVVKYGSVLSKWMEGKTF